MKLVNFFGLVFLLYGCISLEYPSDEIIKEREYLKENRSYILDEWAPAINDYDKYYKSFLNGVENGEYYPIWFNSLGIKNHGVIYLPEKKLHGTVLMVHGYAGNSLGFRYIASKLLQEGYSIATLSLPGHEISDGERGDIEDFREYGELVNDYIKFLRVKGFNVEYAIGHSTGCSSLIIYNELYGWNFKKVVFIAPLIQSVYWLPSKVVRFLSKPFINYYNTKWRDTMALYIFPIHWFDELIEWNDDLRFYKKQDEKILLFQGEQDDVVNWKYNIPKIRSIYPDLEVVKYKEGNHTMFISDVGIGSEIINKIVNYFL